jgi:hypothetical protein
MDTDKGLYLSRLFNPLNRDSVLEECFLIASERLAHTDIAYLKKCWKMTSALFAGHFPGYNACNTEYHDYNHTCDVFGATIRMIDGAISRDMALGTEIHIDLCLAAMLHDSGYIQESGDSTGTGAKYTKTHVERSIAFTVHNKEILDLSPSRLARICRLIEGTNLSVKFAELPFPNETEKLAGQVLATADLLGQMADRTYLEKLLFLYYEFKEAGFPDYITEFDMLKKTLGFYEMTKDRLFNVLGNTTILALHHFSSRYGVQKNLYMESIERQMDYLKSIMDDDTANFRTKLKRIDLESVSNSRKIGVCAETK